MSETANRLRNLKNVESEPGPSRSLLKNIGPLTMLRIFGGIAVVGAAATFLIQQWDTAGGIHRYYGLLGLTALLPFVAFLCGIGLKEGRGARTLMGSLLTLVPAHFAILAGLLYSQVHWDAGPGDTPAYALWVAPGLFEALGTLALGLVVLAPVMFLAFRILARAHHRLLFACYGVANAALLIPTRDGTVMGLLVAGLLAAFVCIERGLFGRSPAVRTPEGLWARAVLFLPLLMMAIRQVQLYSVNGAFLALACSCVAVLLFLFAPGLPRRIAPWVQGASVPFAAVAWFLWTRIVDDNMGFSVSHWLLFFGLPIAGLLFAQSFAAVGNGKAYRIAAAIVGGVFSALAIGFGPNLTASMAVMTVGVVFVVVAYLRRKPVNIVIGSLWAVAGLGTHVYLAAKHSALVGWGGLAAVGVLVILGASVLERHGPQARALYDRWTTPPIYDAAPDPEDGQDDGLSSSPAPAP